MTASPFVDASGSAAAIQDAITNLLPQTNVRIGSYMIGSKIRFYSYDIA